jgi:hypothetical protein
LDVIFVLVILGEIWWRTRYEQQRGYLDGSFLSLLYQFDPFATLVLVRSNVASGTRLARS